MAEGGVDNVRERHAGNELVEADAGKALVFGEQPIVGRGVELEDRLEVLVVIGDADEDAVARVAGRHESMRVELADERDRRQRAVAGGGVTSHRSPGAARVEEPAHVLHRREAAAHHVLEGRGAGEERVGVGTLHPHVGQRL
jgi:hypothetical protein